MKKIYIFTFILFFFSSKGISQVSIVGTATQSHDWQTLYPMEVDPTQSDLWIASIALDIGELKFVRTTIPDSVGGQSFPIGIGLISAPPINIPESNVYIVRFNSTTLEYTFSVGRIGINVLDPQSTLDINGSVSVRGSVVEASGGLVSISSSSSFITITGNETDTIHANLPFTFADGLQMIVHNQSNQPIRVHMGYLESSVILIGHSMEYIHSTSGGWMLVGCSGEANNPPPPVLDSWLLAGNEDTNPNEDFVGTIDSTRLIFRTNNQNRLNISPNGHVGIGTADPDNFLARLDITNNYGNVLRLNTVNNSDTGDKTSLLFHSDNLFRGEISTIMSSPSSSRIGFFTGLVLPPHVFPQERLSVAFGGNIGISNTAPSQRLEVNGKIKVGNDAAQPSAGTMRWNESAQDFEGYNGTEWLSLTKSKQGGWGGIDLIQEDETEIGPYPDAFRRIGSVIAIDGNIAVVGSSVNGTYYNGATTQGKVYIYEYAENQSSWHLIDSLSASDGYADDGFGESLSLTPSYLVVGAPSADDFPDDQAGKVYIFKRYNTSDFVEEAILYGENQDDYFGTSVDLNSSGHLIIGAPNYDIGFNYDQGKAYIYFIWGTGFSPYAQPLVSYTNPDPANSFFGEEVDMTDNYYAYVSGLVLDKVYAYHYESQVSGYNFYPVGEIAGASGPMESFEYFGTEPGWLIVGKPNMTVGGNVNQGLVRIYKRLGATWTLNAEIYGGDSVAGDKFGSGVSINGNYCVVGSPKADVNSVTNQGKAYIFYKTGDQWNQKAMLTVTNGTVNDEFGTGVCITPDYAGIGAMLRDNLGNLDQGAVYFFRR